MSEWLELLLLAVASMFWPTLIVIVVLALRVPHPVKILGWFLAGGLMTTIAVGVAIVFALQGTSIASGSGSGTDSAVYITIGLLSLAAAFALDRRGAREPAVEQVSGAASPAPEKPPLTQRAVEQGAPVAFAAGVVLNIVPGTFPIVALKDIAQLNASNGAMVATVIAFYVIMFAFVEVPIVAFLFSPERTTAVTNEFNAWLKRNGRRLAIYVLAGVGMYLTVRGVIQLVR